MASSIHSHFAGTTLAATEREDLLHQAAKLSLKAEQAALEGDLETAARIIIQSLNHERRANSLGPQVLRLIKPRS